MPTGWETSVVECRGGLVTNIAPLQQGLNATGTARRLVNFEPSIKGGYRRIEGFEKYDETKIPSHGEPVVQGSGQTGTSLEIANVFKSPSIGDEITLSGIGTYSVSGVSFDSTEHSATLTLGASLASSPADKLAVVFTDDGSIPVSGLQVFSDGVVASRGGNVYYSTGSGWSRINVPSHGSSLVAGGGQSGGTLAVDALTSTPLAGETFTVDGIEKVYTVTADATVVAGAATLTISPNLASSPSDNAAITWLGSDAEDSGRVRFDIHQFSGVNTLIGVTGTSRPFKYDGTTFEIIAGTSDTTGSEFVVEFKNHIFYGKGSLLTFSEPYLDNDFDPGDGAGTINLPYTLTGLQVFRDNLIVFSTNSIHYVTGSSITDFALSSISDDIGCVAADTIQEVGGDVIFLGPDGLRLLSGTEKFNDFGLAVASRPIQQDAKELVESNTTFASCVIRAKSQYRIFGYKSSTLASSSRGLAGVQFADQTAEGMAWSKLKGFKAYVASSEYRNDLNQELIVFANADGYVYKMETGNSFDGANIQAIYSTPYLSVTDPSFRKTIYKVYTYVDPDGVVSGSLQLRFDFSAPEKIQPSSVAFSDSGSSTPAFYGTAIYGTSRYGSRTNSVRANLVVGSGDTVSFEYSFDNTNPPFSIDAIVFEYRNNDRQ
jgi:hypothetical protein